MTRRSHVHVSGSEDPPQPSFPSPGRSNGQQPGVEPRFTALQTAARGTPLPAFFDRLAACFPSEARLLLLEAAGPVASAGSEVRRGEEANSRLWGSY